MAAAASAIDPGGRRNAVVVGLPKDEVLQFNGDGSLSTPAVTAANPFGDLGNVLHPPTGGAPGLYSINDDCTGTVQFSDVNGVTFNIYVDPPKGDTIWMIQTNPLNNVFQGIAKRVP